MELALIPIVGINDLKFGCTPAEVTKCFGEPEEIEELNDDLLNDNALVYHYWDIGLSIFFSIRENKIFSSLEIDNKDAILFGKRIFDLNEKEIIALFKENNFKLSESENHEWGEKRLSFDDINVDLYFANNKLSSINYGTLQDNSSFYYFPN